MPYARLALIIAVATLVIFCVSYLNVYQADHIWLSAGRLWMAVAAGAAVAAALVAFSPDVYRSGPANSVIVAAAITVFAAAAWLVRTQDGVHEMTFLRAMIPHHSAAILMAERAQLRDPRVRELARRIVTDQMQEISEMERLIADLERTGGRPAPAQPRDGQSKTVSR
ncbi:DUF305 domain-containing protein [Methylocystis echinoides]|jgi:hypothetical protein|uniref:DUF305 domain-containing protein n=1 Tax=Methylocystis echinoides TaxID=29468 RepID=UPI00343ABAB7